MRIPATVSLFLFLFASSVSGQSDLSLRYAIGGFVFVPEVQNHNPMEVRLVNEMEIPMGQARVYPQERFLFSNLPSGRYHLLMNVPGYKPVRQRVDAVSFGTGISASIFLEPLTELKAPRPLYLTGEADLVDVKELDGQGKVLKYLAAAEKQLKKGAISEARSRLESLVRETPDSYDARRLLASAYQQSRRYAEAAKEYRAAHALRPRSPEVLISLGGLYLEQIDAETPDKARSILDEARTVLIQAIQISPDAAFAHYLLGVTYYKNQTNGEAEKSFRRALDLEPRLVEAHLGLSNVYVRRADWPAVLAELNSYLRKAPHSSNRERVLKQRRQVERIANGQPTATPQP